MGALRLFLGKYVTLIEITLVVLLLAFGVMQTVRLEHARTTISEQNARAATLQASREKQRADDESYARAVEGQLRDTAAAIQKESDETQRTLRARADALSRELRNRPERPAPGSEAAATPAPACSCTGAGLYRADADVALWFATEAAERARERDQCQRQYRAAEQALKQYEGSTK